MAASRSSGTPGYARPSRSDGLRRFALHTVTTKPWPIETAIDAYARAGFGGISIWREALQDRDPAAIRRQLREAGLVGVSLVRGGFFAGADAHVRARALEENRRCIAEAAELELPLVVLVCGADPNQSPAESRRQIVDALVALAPEAEAAGVHLGIEPLHPMYADTRSAVNTLTDAVDMALESAGGAGAAPAPGAAATDRGGATADRGAGAGAGAAGGETSATTQPPLRTVCTVVDAYHLWWDPRLEGEIRRAGREGLLGAFHVSDWKVPTEDLLLDRGLMGEGCIDLPGIRRSVDAAGFDGFIEVEIFSRQYWNLDQAEWLAMIAQACRESV